jgi:Sensors of blue-light using FAD
MIQLTYISTGRDMDDAGLQSILDASRRNNRRDEITGLLLFNGKRFLQALEGPQPLVEKAYERIQADRRHRAPVILATNHVDCRQFGSWDMAFEHVRAFERSQGLIDKVDALVARVSDLNIRAQFSSYVRLSTAA